MSEIEVVTIVAGVVVLLYTLRVIHARKPGQESMCWFHWYETVEDTYIRRYLRCEKCGARQITNMQAGGQPIDMKWLDTGEWTVMHPPMGSMGVPAKARKDVQA